MTSRASEDPIALIHAVKDLIQGRELHGALATEFEGICLPDFDSAGVAQLAEFVRAHLAAVIASLASEDDATRHLAAFMLRFSGDARCVQPLLELLTDQRDRFDHDYCYSSLGSLEKVANEPLFEIAKDGSGEQCVQAVQAIGHSGATGLPWLAKLAELGVVPPGFFSAVYNTHDPSALPMIEFGLTHSDDEHRSEALFTAYCLLEFAHETSHPVLQQIDREKWGDHMATLFADPQVAEREVALNAIGYLGDRRHLQLLRDSLANSDFEECAAEALACFDDSE